MEKTPTDQDYALRKLYPLYYLHLGALASIALSDNDTWRKVYQERLEEIKKEILENGGSV